MNPKDLRYSKSHEWVRWDGEKEMATLGLTDYAQSQLGDIVFLALLPVGTELHQSEKLGEVESVKAVADLFSPVDGEIIEINQALSDSPELVNKDPYGTGWLARLKLKNSSELDDLMTSEQYEGFLAQEAPEEG